MNFVTTIHVTIPHLITLSPQQAVDSVSYSYIIVYNSHRCYVLPKHNLPGTILVHLSAELAVTKC